MSRYAVFFGKVKRELVAVPIEDGVNMMQAHLAFMEEILPGKKELFFVVSAETEEAAITAGRELVPVA